MSHIDACHRVRPPRADPLNKADKAIVVKFTSRMKKELILQAARKGNVTTKDLGFDGECRKLFLNEHLSLANKILYKRTRVFCTNRGFKFCWVKYGKIFINIIKFESSAIS